MSGIVFIMNAINVIFPYPTRGMWVFDDEARGLVQEPFVFGTDEIIAKISQWILGYADRKFKLTFSGYPLPEFHAKYIRTSKECYAGSYYKVETKNSDISGMEGWLCPATLKYFEEYPEHIYMYLQPFEE